MVNLTQANTDYNQIEFRREGAGRGWFPGEYLGLWFPAAGEPAYKIRALRTGDVSFVPLTWVRNYKNPDKILREGAIVEYTFLMECGDVIEGVGVITHIDDDSDCSVSVLKDSVLDGRGFVFTVESKYLKVI